jgi:hypothetical protein
MTTAKFRAKFATAGRLAPIENWLKLNIEGEWSIKMDSISDDMSKKTICFFLTTKTTAIHLHGGLRRAKKLTRKNWRLLSQGFLKKFPRFLVNQRKTRSSREPQEGWIDDESNDKLGSCF